MAEQVKASLPCHPMSVLPEENVGFTGAGETSVGCLKGERLLSPRNLAHGACWYALCKCNV